MADQAEHLRNLMVQKKNDQEPHPANARIIAVSSGKGGVGKTSLVVNLAIALSKAGKKVMIMDADLGLANVDIMLGISPRYTLFDVLEGNKSLHEIIITGVEGINVIPGCSGLFAMENISRLQKQNLLQELGNCIDEMDYILIDTGAGISSIVLGFLAAAGDALIVVTPEPTSITDGYAIIKILSQFKLHEKVYLVVNMAANPDEVKESFDKIEAVAGKFLNIEIVRLGAILFDDTVKKSIIEMNPFIINYPRSQASRDVMQIAENLSANKFTLNIRKNFVRKMMNLLR
jgi:flagellar biosynthesis protein FlhG